MGRSRVRSMTSSMSRSAIWLNAAAPPATSADPTSTCSATAKSGAAAPR